jgi:lipoprotein-releasing system ATP-binding protein
MAEEAEDVPVIYLHEIKREYRQGEATLTILNGAKLALWAGQSVALVAPSGSGKSTLLHIAGLLESPDDGEVYVAGTPTSQLSDTERTQIRRSDIGFVYQSHRLLPEFTALENVMLPQMIRGLKRSETIKRSEEILAYLGLGDRITHRPAELSGGEQQRGRQCAAGAIGGRADRKSRSAHRRSRVQCADAAGEGDAGRDVDRHPQHGTGRPDGPAGVAGRRPGCRTGVVHDPEKWIRFSEEIMLN